MTRRSPVHGVNLLDASGMEVQTFATPQVGPFPGDVDGFADGTMVVCNQGSGAQLYDAGGNHVGTITAPGIVRSFGVHVDANDELWIADIVTVGVENGAVFHFDRQGTLLGSFQTAFEASDLVVAPDGTLWVADRNKGRAVHMQPTGAVIGSFPAVAPGQMMSGIALLPDGTLVCTAEFETRLLRYDTAGNLLGTIPLTAGANPLFLDVADGLTWSNLGHALAGAVGEPLLSGQGDLQPGTPVFLQLASAAPGAASALIVGLQQVDLPFLGGTLVPSPDVLLVGLPTGATGGWILAGTWPAGVPAGTLVRFQAWIPDAVTPFGYAASNGLQAEAP